MKKTTNELQNEISSSKSIEAYLDTNKNEFVENSISAVLKNIIAQKQLTKAEVIDRAGLNEIYAYQIFAGKRTPSRDKVIALCIGMQLTLDEIQTVLKHGQYSQLYARDSRDSVIIFSIIQNNNVIECNNLLYEHGFELL